MCCVKKLDFFFFAVLSDPQTRAIYDIYGKSGLEMEGWEVRARNTRSTERSTRLEPVTGLLTLCHSVRHQRVPLYPCLPGRRHVASCSLLCASMLLMPMGPHWMLVRDVQMVPELTPSSRSSRGVWPHALSVPSDPNIKLIQGLRCDGKKAELTGSSVDLWATFHL